MIIALHEGEGDGDGDGHCVRATAVWCERTVDEIYGHYDAFY